MSTRFALIAVFALNVIPRGAAACEYDPFLFQLPGESVEAAQSRSDAIMADAAVIRKADRENYDFEKAAQIYLGRKVASSKDPKTDDWLTVVRPVHAVRGPLPKEDKMLRSEAHMGGMCGSVGDGDIWNLPKGTYVVVFVGLPGDGYRRRGIDSFDVDEIRNDKLLDTLRAFGKDLE